MGGAVRGRGNVTAAAEFNVYADPEAAAIVFQRVPELTLLPWEVCLDNLVPFERWDLLTDAGPLGRKFVRPLTNRPGEVLRGRGPTVATDETCSDLPANTHVVTSVDMPRFLGTLERTFAQECGL